jgi:DNA uptake protein ComE-like DNA-binding protein
MTDYLNDFFSWSKKERIGVIVLSIVLLSLFLLNFFFDRWFIPEQAGWNADSLKYYTLILESLEKDLENLQPKLNADSLNNFKKVPEKNQPINYFPFDPNKIKTVDWIKLGFSKKQTEIILKFKKSIGGFRTTEDLGRCFVIDENKMSDLSPFIRIDTTLLNNINSDRNDNYQPDNPIIEKENKKSVIVEINSADSIQLLEIRGIGPYFANKILSYRNKLGGYIKKEQLLEIWNFDSVRYEKINEQFIIDTSLILKINVNRVDANFLKLHPYIRWSLANAMVKYREQHGDYNNLSDIKNVVLMTDSIYNKLYPYLVIE